MDTLTDLYDLLGLAPRALARNSQAAPPFGEHPYVPFDTSAVPGTAFGTPYPGGFAAPTADGGRETEDGRASPPPVSSASPLPRPDLPRALMQGPGSDGYAGYRDVYAPAQEPVDPVAQIVSTLGQHQPQAPMSRTLAPPWTARPAQPLPPYGAGQPRPASQPLQHAGPTPGERALLRRSPAYARAIARIRSLDRMRDRQGF